MRFVELEEGLPHRREVALQSLLDRKVKSLDLVDHLVRLEGVSQTCGSLNRNTVNLGRTCTLVCLPEGTSTSDSNGHVMIATVAGAFTRTALWPRLFLWEHVLHEQIELELRLLAEHSFVFKELA